MKRYDLAAKCYRQALQSVKESNLGERERNIKTGEIQGLLKQLRNIVAAINDAMQVSEHFTLEWRTEIFSVNISLALKFTEMQIFEIPAEKKSFWRHLQYDQFVQLVKLCDSRHREDWPRLSRLSPRLKRPAGKNDICPNRTESRR